MRFVSTLAIYLVTIADRSFRLIKREGREGLPNLKRLNYDRDFTVHQLSRLK
jgi:hypothetical protein